MDTGATDHLTSELARLHAWEPYQGRNRVHTAAGSCMHISHIGQDLFLTHTSRNIILSNILCVPLVQSNLLFVKNSLVIMMSLLNFIILFFFKDRSTKYVHEIKD
jgi:hypothetical protein